MEHIKLSILICHLNCREEPLAILRAILDPQVEGKPVEILISGDNGEMSIGTKRNSLLFSAHGEYVAFVDDDDLVSGDYVQEILAAIEKGNPDCVGIEGEMHTNLGNAIFRHSIEYQGWYTGIDAYYRTPNHLNPVKKSIAQGIRFPDLMFGEDQLYSEALRRTLKTEVYIDHPIYFYKKEFPTA